MDPNRRFKRDHPCPVCSGHEGLPQGKGRRCYGFVSDDGLYAHCTREECAGSLDRNGNSNTYAHFLNGDCLCGEVHGVGPTPARSLPESRQGAPNVGSYRHPDLGRPSQTWPYRFADGELACYVARFDKTDGGKTFRPLILEDGSWRSKGIPEPLLLYNLPELRKDPDAPVLVVEGEKTSDAVSKLLPAYVSITSMHGAKAPQVSDWRPLEGRDVVIWPDNDSDGQRYAQQVASLVLKAAHQGSGLCSCLKACLPNGILADPVPRGVDVEKLLADAKPTDLEEAEPVAGGDRSGRGHSLSSGDRLLQWASEESDLYYDGEEAYADVQIDGHRETLSVRSKGFKRWLGRLCFERTGKGVAQEALTHAERNLDAQAAMGGQRRVHQRTATYEGRLYIDLCDDSRRVVEIDSGGWRVLSDAPGVQFRRTKTTEPLPEPVGGEAGKGLRGCVRSLGHVLEWRYEPQSISQRPD